MRLTFKRDRPSARTTAIQSAAVLPVTEQLKRCTRRLERRAVGHAYRRRVVEAAGGLSTVSNLPPALSALAAGRLAAGSGRAPVRRARRGALSESAKPLAAARQVERSD